VKLDPQANAQAPSGQAVKISAPDSAVQVWVIPTNEERMIALHTRSLVLGG